MVKMMAIKIMNQPKHPSEGGLSSERHGAKHFEGLFVVVVGDHLEISLAAMIMILPEIVTINPVTTFPQSINQSIKMFDFIFIIIICLFEIDVNC